MARQDRSNPSNDEFEYDSSGREGFFSLGNKAGKNQKELYSKVPTIAESFVERSRLIVGGVEIVGEDQPKGNQKSEAIQLVQS
eukprot:CAMPEP_0116116962 /NCGR_PEP_ID=MMETSP0329-20121206/1318_1 /TAXON_ID=697910 /ORGANISM="Pseudo-nitzschia arenysensis, Strain B593" /LENGTH=82 /DNA_ID=CAMNT_0003610493 /DNA_START=580 /DNA_END=824 /DNA_ORIENTATION=-